MPGRHLFSYPYKSLVFFRHVTASKGSETERSERWKVYGIKHLKQYKLKDKKVKMSLCLTNEALRHEGVWGSGRIDTHFLDPGNGWR
jgi:hypothetical protein